MFNKSQQSDSTGAITGNILGPYLGRSNIPEIWLNKVELNQEISQLADDLLIGYEDAHIMETTTPRANSKKCMGKH